VQAYILVISASQGETSPKMRQTYLFVPARRSQVKPSEGKLKSNLSSFSNSPFEAPPLIFRGPFSGLNGKNCKIPFDHE
jgi:hypothetical protein